MTYGRRSGEKALGLRRALAILCVLFAAIGLTAFAAVPRSETDSGGVWVEKVAVESRPPEVPAPRVAASSWALFDAETGEYLAGEDPGERLPMGSTDKIMVSLVALDLVSSGEADLDEEVTVSRRAASFARPIYSNIGLREGDVLSVRELIMAALIHSGNDASWALAEHLGGGDVRRFVEKMNRKADELGLEDTHFRNPTGLDARGQHSSARDLAAMARAAFEYPLFREAVATDYATVTTQDREIELATTNELLSTYTPATGVKTGYTPGAGPCLVASAAADGESYVSVVLGDEERFPDSARILDHGFAANDRLDLIHKGKRYAEAGMPYRRGETVDLVARNSIEGLVDANSRAEREVRVIDEMPAAVEPGTRLGEIVLKVDGKVAGKTPLVAKRGYGEASLWEKARYTVSGLWTGE